MSLETADGLLQKNKPTIDQREKPLWVHQELALQALRDTIISGIKRVILQAPTGSGKSRIGAEIIKGALKKDKKVSFVVPAISLIDQTLEVLYNEGIPEEWVGVVQADHDKTDWSRPFQVCSVATIRRRIFPEADVVIFDECHVLHDTHKKWMKEPRFKDVPFIGLSATPYTRGLGKFFDTKIVVATTQELIDKGILSKFITFATGHPNLDGIKTTAGDYNQKELSNRMQSGGLTADIVRTWEQRWGKDRTFLFAVDRAHAQQLQKRFQEAGISAGYQDADTTRSERKQLKEQFHSGEIKVLTNVGTLTTGVDYDVRCLILARPTKSPALYQQIIGRALRSAPGKDFAVVLDHSDTTSRLGFITDVEAKFDSLDMGDAKAKPFKGENLPKVCPKCGVLRPPKFMSICPSCGFESKPKVSAKLENDGELFEITKDGMLVAPRKSGKAELWNLKQQMVFMAELKAFALSKGRKMGWAAYAYKKKFGGWPSDSVAAVTPANEPGVYTRAYCKSLDIAWFNSKSYRDIQNAKKSGNTRSEVMGPPVSGVSQE